PRGQPCDPRPVRGAVRGRGRLHVLHRRADRRRAAPAGGRYGRTFCYRCTHGRRVARLFRFRRKRIAVMSAVGAQVARFLEGVPRNRREIITPEGVLLPVDLADHGERAVALIIDLFIWMCMTALLYVAIIAVLVEGKGVEIAVTLILFIAFIVRNLYFVYFELAWQGATPGKRINGLRVIDRRGGPLTPSAVFARNLTREVELFLPAGVMLSLGAGANQWERLALLAWLGLFTALPLFNRDRMRGG